MNEIEISLFPIPGSVSLPFSKTSLHVFEPRYRKMIKDSIEAKRRIGVAHTQKVIAEGKSRPGAPIEEILNSNQKTYLAHPVFSAGFAEIQQTLPDGRLLIEIQMDSRYEIKQEIQQVPYKVVLCQPFEDDDSESDDLLRQHMDQILLDLVQPEAEELATFFKSEEWKNLSFLEYSFKVYSFIDCAPDILQKVLELKSSVDRVQFLKDILTRRVVH
jgi:Lon protease-like protein